MLKKVLLVFCALTLTLSFAYSQNDQVKKYMKMLAQGKVADVKIALPDLLDEYPDDPGVLLLHGSVLDDANKAVAKYETIIKKHPESEYADDAYWRIIQFYAIKGELDRANQELEAFRKKFPTSEFLAPAGDIVRTASAIAKAPVKIAAAASEKKATKEEAVTKKEKKTENQSPKQSEKEKVKEKPADKPKIEEKPKEKPLEKPAEKPRAEEKEKGTWGLQVGVYSTQEAAKNEVERFRSMRLRAEIQQKKVEGATMYAVIIGEYSSKESAEAAKNIVQQQCGCSPMVFLKK